MLNLTRYNEIVEIARKYPFLNSALKDNGTKTILDVNDLLDDALFDNYDINLDICDIMGKRFSLEAHADDDDYYSRRSQPYVSNDYSIQNVDRKLAIYMIKNDNLRGIFKYRCFYNLVYRYYAKTDNLEYITTQKYLLINILNYLKSKNVSKDIFLYDNLDNVQQFELSGALLFNYTSLVYKIFCNINELLDVGWSTLFNLLTDDEFKLINDYFEFLDEYCNKNDTHTFNIKTDENEYTISDSCSMRNQLYIHSDSVRCKLNEILDKYIAWVYNNMSSSDIEQLCQNKLSKLDNMFSWVRVEYKRKLNILNEKLSDEEKAQLLLQFKSADSIKRLCTNLLNEHLLSFDRLSYIIDECILNNTKIKDRKFPVDKRKVIVDMIKFLFISDHGYSVDAYDMKDENDIYKLINKYRFYFYNPYFIESIYNTLSMWTDRNTASVENTKTLLIKLFSNERTKDNISYFIREYIESIYKNDISSSVCKSSTHLTYGSLKMFISKYMSSIISKDAIKKVIIDEYFKLNVPDDKRYQLLLFYSIYNNSEKMYTDMYQRLSELKEYDNTTATSYVKYASPFRKYILGEATHSLAQVFKYCYRVTVDNIWYVQQHGFLESLLVKSIDSNTEKIERKLDDICLSVYYYGRRDTSEFSNTDKSLRLNAKRFVLLKFIDYLKEDANVSSELLESCVNSLKELFTNENEIILTESCSGGIIPKEEPMENEHVINERNNYIDVIDLDTFLLYNDFIKLNDDDYIFNIDSSLNNLVLIPLVDPLNRSFSSGYNRYSYTKNCNNKYNENSTSIKMYNDVAALTDEQKEEMFNKLFKPYIDDDFSFNEIMSSTLFLYLDKAIEYLKVNTYGSSLKRYFYTSINDLSESLVNGSASDTLVESYRYFISDVFEDKHSEEFEELFNKLEQMSINYNCMTSLLG